ncbi:MAG: hypothetical protein JXR96_14340 [Deltaproteobacteria bacterium]|nr:hypothetical protein [Deltaproteobacteria bacterium]
MRRCALLGLYLLAISACGASEEEDIAFQAIPATAPELGEADSTDAADRGCALILRWAERQMDEQGELLTHCRDGACSWIWKGMIDAASSEIAAGASVGVLYTSPIDGSWWEVPAAYAGAGRVGFSRFEFWIEEHAPGPDTAGGRLELVPFLRRPDGSRLFDHNAHPGDFENYGLGPERGFGPDIDAYVCTRRARTAAIHFTASFDEWVEGELRAGERVAILYDLDRLPRCRNTHNGAPAWDLTAFARIYPHGEEHSASVRTFVSQGGTPSTVALSVPFELDLPEDATAIELWFRNASGAGSSCVEWDSDYSANYLFDVLPPVGSDPCAKMRMWEDKYHASAYCPERTPDIQADASFCEFVLDGLGDGYEGHYGIPFRWLDAYLSVGPQDGSVRDAGIYVSFFDHSIGEPDWRMAFGREIEPGMWHAGFTYLFTGYMGDSSYRYTIDAYAFFLDVQRPSGELVRLWQSRGGANYAWEDAFCLPTSTEYIPYGREEWASQDSAVFDHQRACRQ